MTNQRKPDLDKVDRLFRRYNEVSSILTKAQDERRALANEMAVELGLDPDGIGRIHLARGLVATRLPSTNSFTGRKALKYLNEKGAGHLVRNNLVLTMDLVDEPEIALDPKFRRIFEGTKTAWSFRMDGGR